MMFGWTKSKRETGEKQRRSLRPARLGLLVFALICAGIAYWDISANGATDKTFIETEVRIPRSNLGVKKGDVIRIYSWGNIKTFFKNALIYRAKFLYI